MPNKNKDKPMKPIAYDFNTMYGILHPLVLNQKIVDIIEDLVCIQQNVPMGYAFKNLVQMHYLQSDYETLGDIPPFDTEDDDVNRLRCIEEATNIHNYFDDILAMVGWYNLKGWNAKSRHNFRKKYITEGLDITFVARIDINRCHEGWNDIHKTRRRIDYLATTVCEYCKIWHGYEYNFGTSCRWVNPEDDTHKDGLIDVKIFIKLS